MDDTKDTNVTTFIVANIMLTVLFLAGLYLQIKICLISKNEKDMTWKLHICNSMVMISYYCFRIGFEFVTFFIPHLHEHTGKWFCYVALAANVFGALSIASHSIVISMYKYVYIVHHNLIRRIGADESSTISFWISLFLPAVFTISYVARPEGTTYSSISTCLETKVEKATEVAESSVGKIKMLLFCGFEDDDYSSMGVFGYFMNITSLIGCFFTSVMIFVCASNVVEAFFYQRIFSFMKRYVHILIFHPFFMGRYYY